MELFAACCQASAKVAERASPQKRLQRRVGNAPGCNSPTFEANMATDGTENQQVNSFSSTKVAGVSVCSVYGQSVAPASQQVNRSCTLRSNVKSKFCEQRSAALKPNRFFAYSMYATAFDWLTATPFGIPVLPEVNSKYAVAFPSTAGLEGSVGSATFDNWRAATTWCLVGDPLVGSQPGSGTINVNG